MILALVPRGCKRYPVHKIASYHHEGKRFLTVTMDLGLGGMRIKTHHYLPEGEHLDFKLVLGSDFVWLKGRIIYSGVLPDKQTVSGIQFTELSRGDHTLLKGYLATLEPLPKPRGIVSAGEKECEGLTVRKTAKK